MIIIRYIVRETVKSQIAILFVLLLIFFCQKLLRILDAAVSGNVPTDLIISLLGLGIPQMAQLILPLSLFLALLMTYGRLHMESEITAMYACGVGKQRLFFAAMLLAIFTAVIAFINVSWWSPISVQQQNRVVAEAKANPSLATLVEGQFQSSGDGSSVLFVGKVKGDQFSNIFLARLKPHGRQRPSIVVANHGYMELHGDGSRTVFLDEGTLYEGTAMLRDFRITHFSHYRTDMGYQVTDARDPNSMDQKTLPELWRTSSSVAEKTELHWRLTLVASVFLMALIVLPLSEVDPRQGRVVSMLPAILLYLIYFLLQSTITSNAQKGKLDPVTWLWGVNAIYFILAIVLNLWDTILGRRLRAYFKGVA